MSEHKIEVVLIEEVKKHPNADRLQLIRTAGWWCSDLLDNFKVGDKAVYIPPNSIITEEWATKWNIINYTPELPSLNGIRPPGRRVLAARLRGIPSFGVFVRPEENWDVGTDVSEYYNIKKYEPIQKFSTDDGLPDLPNLFKYTDIKNLANYPEMFNETDKIVITEKIHGTNCVVGYIWNDTKKEKIFVASSHNNRRMICIEYYLKIFNYEKTFKIDYNEINKNIKTKIFEYFSNFNITYKNLKFIRIDFTNLYSYPFKDKNIFKLIEDLKNYKTINNEENDVLIYGEIFGRGIQDMTYGTLTPKFRVFDIRINSNFLDHVEMYNFCKKHYIETVPELYLGKYSKNIVDEMVSGNTTICDIKNISEPFKGREGIVIKPLKEDTYNFERKIAKYISVDYYSRKNKEQTENH